MKKRSIGYLLVLSLLALVLSFVIWAASPPAILPEAEQALRSTDQVRVEIGRWLVFHPVGPRQDLGIIFYPGGRVDARAYAPAAHAIAQDGYLVVLMPMPLNFAFFAPDRALDVIESYPAISHWVLAGHSLGGAMAARFADAHPGVLSGLALWAAYPASSDDLSTRDLAVISIYGTQDGLTTLEDIAASRALLPLNTTWLPIEGGNHAQFGWYGAQAGDNPATITRQEQQSQIQAGMQAFLQDISGPGG